MHNTFECTDELLFALCKKTDTPYSLGVWLRHLHQCEEDNNPPNASLYDHPAIFAADYQCFAYLSKLRPATKDRKALQRLRDKALEGFIADEQFNRETNRRLRFILSRPSTEPGVEAVIHTARRKIQKILGPFDSFRKFEGCFGNGSSDIRKRSESTRAKKYALTPSVTASAHVYYYGLLSESSVWRELCESTKPIRSHGSVFDTVRKNVKTDRTIAKEPVINGYLQQAVGRHIVRRLKPLGIDLTDQSRNQKLAHDAYTCGLSTLDLKSASNSLTCSLVQLLLPDDWFLYLNQIRTDYTILPGGRPHRYELFSSMGNGFTFALESLIFWAISSHFGFVSVFGDDIICERRFYDDTVRMLNFFGFRVNEAKSFRDGNFFESCGHHYFRGCNVTPVYQKARLQTGRSELEFDLVRCGNRLFRWTLQTYGVIGVGVAWSAYLAVKRRCKVKGPLTKHGDPFLFDSILSTQPLKLRLKTVVREDSHIPDPESGRYLCWLDTKSNASSRVLNEPREDEDGATYRARFSVRWRVFPGQDFDLVY